MTKLTAEPYDVWQGKTHCSIFRETSTNYLVDTLNSRHGKKASLPVGVSESDDESISQAPDVEEKVASGE